MGELRWAASGPMTGIKGFDPAEAATPGQLRNNANILNS
jgi:hypothetical protein